MAHTLNSNNDMQTKTEAKDFVEDDCKSAACLNLSCVIYYSSQPYADEHGSQKHDEYSC